MVSIPNKILQYLEIVGRPVTPFEIKQNTKINHNSVRVNLIRLLRKGKIRRDFYGHYSIISTHGMGFDVPPRVQNLFVIADSFKSGNRVSVSRDLIGVKDVFPFGDDGAQVCIEYGWKRGNVFWRLAAPLGLDLYGLRLVVSLVDSVCKGRGFVGLHWMVKNFEFLWDHDAVKFEGVKALTLQSFDTVLEKYYVRDGGLRKEIRGSLPTELDHILALVQGGQPAFQLIQGVGVLTKKIDSLVEAQKGQNRQLSNQSSLIKALYESQIRLTDTMNQLLKDRKT